MAIKQKLIIIGGGVSGLGVGVLAARAGFAPLIIEAHTIHRATSNNSLRIMHGGFRYLQQLGERGTLRRIIESITEQNRLLKTYPNLVQQLPCLMPLQARGIRSAIPMRIAHLLYQLGRYGLTGAFESHCYLRRAECEVLVPDLIGHFPCGAFRWIDALLLDPAALACTLAAEITAHGGQIEEHMLAQTVLPNENDVEIRVIQNGSEQLLTADLVVNASGSRLKEVLPQSLWDSLPPLKWVRAFNLVLRTQLHPTHAIALTAPQSSRLYFFVPRSSPIKGGATAVGTYYLPMPAGEHTERISESEVQNFLNEINATVQSSRYSLNDVLAIESGILPAKRVTQSAIELYGSEQILRQKRIVQVLSTKYTTYHSQAQKVLKALAQPM